MTVPSLKPRQFIAGAALVAGLACDGTAPTAPQPPQRDPNPLGRIWDGIDSVNAAIRDLYEAGGHVGYLTLVRFDTTQPPELIASLYR
jgi:hypothetical protein